METIGNIYLYAKKENCMKDFQYVLDNIHNVCNYNEIFISRETRRSFTELEKIKETMRENDVCVITNPASLGLNETEIVSQLDWFIQKSRMLLICDFKMTYQWGVFEPLNQAVLQSIQQTVLMQSGKRMIKIQENRKSNAGRNRIEFPANWDELYEKWQNKTITSKEFLEKTKLKRATFYNLLTEYKQMQKEMGVFSDNYKAI